jgi:hypothetical protein
MLYKEGDEHFSTRQIGFFKTQKGYRLTLFVHVLK